MLNDACMFHYTMGHGYQDLHELQMALHKAQNKSKPARRRTRKDTPPRTARNDRRSTRPDAPRYILDTNTIMYLVDNPHFRSMLSIRLDLGDSDVYLGSTICQELQKHGCPHVEVVDCIRDSLKANVVSFHPTIRDREEASRLESTYDTLHWPDSLILAETAARKATLVTRDRGLAAAAKEHGVPVVNPDLLCT